MGRFTEIYTRVKSLGMLQENGNIPTSLIKLGEETGEFNEAYLRSISYKRGKGTDPERDMKEECVDTLIMILDIANKLDMSKKELYVLLDAKLDKWENKYCTNGEETKD